MAKLKDGPVYQLKITLADLKPPVWRRVQVQDCTLSKLHQVIQIVMGWGGYHLWAFDIEGDPYGDDPENDPDMVSARKLRLSEMVHVGIKKFRYTYDLVTTGNSAR